MTLFSKWLPSPSCTCLKNSYLNLVPIIEQDTQPWHYWYFELGNSMLWWAFMCIILGLCHSSCDNQNCLQMLPNISCREKLPPVEICSSRAVYLKKKTFLWWWKWSIFLWCNMVVINHMWLLSIWNVATVHKNSVFMHSNPWLLLDSTMLESWLKIPEVQMCPISISPWVPLACLISDDKQAW